MFELLQKVDGGALVWIENVLRQDWLDPVVVLFTHLGDKGVLWIALCLLMLLYRPTRKAGALGLAAMALGAVCTNLVLKTLVARPRPFLEVAGLTPLIPAPDPHSFPSGHTCAAFASAGVWGRTLPGRWMRVLGWTLAVLMGLSRLYVGVHYPADVLGGALVGLAAAYIIMYRVKR